MGFTYNPQVNFTGAQSIAHGFDALAGGLQDAMQRQREESAKNELLASQIQKTDIIVDHMAQQGLISKDDYMKYSTLGGKARADAGSAYVTNAASDAVMKQAAAREKEQGLLNIQRGLGIGKTLLDLNAAKRAETAVPVVQTAIDQTTGAAVPGVRILKLPNGTSVQLKMENDGTPSAQASADAAKLGLGLVYIGNGNYTTRPLPQTGPVSNKVTIDPTGQFYFDNKNNPHQIRQPGQGGFDPIAAALAAIGSKPPDDRNIWQQHAPGFLGGQPAPTPYPVGNAPTPTMNAIPAATGGVSIQPQTNEPLISVTSPDGTPGFVPQSKLKAALAAGYKEQ
jgi:hypothetical protein